MAKTFQWEVKRLGRDSVKILIVDDEPIFSQMVRRLLSVHDHEAETATDGRSALKAIEDDQENSIDLVVTDMELPGMNGIELIRRIQGLRREIPIILASGFVDGKQRLALMELGVPVLEKPFLNTAFLRLVQSAHAIEREGAAR
jgi:CheY-like chemotaxis protein